MCCFSGIVAVLGSLASSGVFEVVCRVDTGLWTTRGASTGTGVADGLTLVKDASIST